MASFDLTLISRIQQANDIVDVISEHIALKRKGREMLGLCPFHDDHSPSFNVSPTKQIFKCFACGAGGDVIKFIQMRENLTFPQALQRLADRAGIKVEPLHPRTSHEPRDTSHEVDPNDLARVNAWAAKYFVARLSDAEKGKEARKYIAERQLNDESLQKWQIGYAPASGTDLLEAAGRAKIPDKLLIAAGLVVGTSDKFVNRLMFTIANESGRIIGFGGRILEGDPSSPKGSAEARGAKYINSPTTILFDKSNSIYGLNNARHQIVSSDTAVVVEGYMDCIMAHQFGQTNVVATLGTSFTAGHARILRRYAKKIVLLFDSDTAGIEAANRALSVALGSRVDIAIASVPQGKDPCDFVLAKGKEPFAQLIDNATDVFKYKWDRLTESLDKQSTIAGKKQVFDEYIDAIATAISSGKLSAVEAGLIVVNRLSSLFKMDAKEINNEISRRIRKTKTLSSYESPGKNLEPLDLGQGLSANAQREIIEVMLAEPKLFKYVDKIIKPADFDVPALNAIAEPLFKILAENPEATIQQVCGFIEDARVASLLTKLEIEGINKGNFKKRLDDAINIFEIERSKKNKEPLKAQSDRRNIGIF